MLYFKSSSGGIKWEPYEGSAGVNSESFFVAYFSILLFCLLICGIKATFMLFYSTLLLFFSSMLTVDMLQTFCICLRILSSHRTKNCENCVLG